MAKKVKSRRLRRKIRKTLGALFLASAIAVAAIPVDDLQASAVPTGVTEVTLSVEESGIPEVGPTETIYFTGDGMFQFAHVPRTSTEANKVAVILGFSTSGTNLEGGALTIPDTVNAYRQLKDNLGSTAGYVAVGKSNNFLYYQNWKQKTDEQGKPLYDKKKVIVYKDGDPIYEEDGLTQKVDKDGNPLFEQIVDEESSYEVDDLDNPIMELEYLPCYYSTESEWKGIDSGRLYTPNSSYDPSDSNSSQYIQTTDERFQRLENITVEFIGNQVLAIDTDGTKTGKDELYAVPIDNEKPLDRGVFSGNGGITSLTIGPYLKGIGNYAFSRCTGITSIDLSKINLLSSIGNHAFDSCTGVSEIKVPVACNLEKIGNHAFYNCQSLESFTLPTQVAAIGDGAFENCFALKSVDLGAQSRSMMLNTLGHHVFKNCENLQSLAFPRSVTGALKISLVEGCEALQSITLVDRDATFIDDPSTGGYTLDKFKGDVRDTFYFEGYNHANAMNVVPEGPTLHYMANQKEFAFKFLNQNIYEIVKKELDDKGEPTGKRAIYRVNDQDQLIFCQIDDGMENIDMPSTIGPYKIKEISSGSFRQNCSLKKIRIPSSVTVIHDYAFQGCHNLKDVIFEEPISLTRIGTGAFKTQETNLHKEGCDGILDAEPVLTFTGPISYDAVTFDYAMNPANNINFGTQKRTYITYYSGWPSNLVVQYNENTDKNELVNYPTLKELEELGNSTTSSESGLNSYPYMTKDYRDAVKDAVTACGGNYKDLTRLTDYQRQILNSALNINLPQGIEAVKDQLFIEKEQNEKDGVEKSLVTDGIAEIPPRTFEGFKSLKRIEINGATSSIGDYAFKDCKNLDSVSISSNVNSLGLRPFAGCRNLADVSFQGGSNYACENSIIYGLNNGEKSTVIQCLEARGRTSGSSSIRADEMAGITGIAQEAFYDCGVSSVDFKESSIDKVPVRAFASTSSAENNLNSVVLPKTCAQIQDEAFKNSRVVNVEIPYQVSYIAEKAFNTNTNSPKEPVTDEAGNVIETAWETSHNIDFYCEPGSVAAIYAANHTNINPVDKPIEREYKVIFWVKDRGVENAELRILNEQIVKGGEDATPPEPPEYEGYRFTGWSPDYKGIGRDMDIIAEYEFIDPDTTKLEVTFLDYDDTEVKVDRVFPGDDAVPPAPDPVREGYRFLGWKPAFTNVTAPMTTWAQYEKIDSEEYKYNVTFLDYDDTVLKVDRVTPGEDAQPPLPPSREDYTFLGWRPDYTNVTEDRTIYAQYEKRDSDDYRHVVTFLDYNDEVLKVERVSEGNDAQPPTDPTREGYRFTGWRPDYRNITENLTIYAQYEKVDSDESKYSVTFVDYDETVLKVDRVTPEQDAQPPLPPSREGYTFTGWRPNYTNVTEDRIIYAQYERMDSDDFRYVVTFLDYDDTVLKVERVSEGDNALPPNEPTREGYRFTGWRPDYRNITESMTIYAQYEKMDSDELRYSVTFMDYDETVLKVDRVTPEHDAQPPLPPSREGYIFTGWRPDYKNVTEDLKIYAQYEKIDSEDTKFIVRFIDFDDNVLSTQRVVPGEDAIEPKDPAREGYRFTGWRPAITNIQKDLDTYAQYEPIGGGGTQTPPDSPGPTATPAPGEPTPTPVPFYTLTVRNGSGSGSYIAGAQVIVIADNPDSNSEFSYWTIDPATAVVASKDTIGTILTMPACNVTMTANYKARVNNGNGNTSTNTNTSTVTRPSGGSTGTSSNGSSNGTTVVINKNGLSNTGVVSVTVNGSTDNFVVKISEDANATEAVLRALMGEYSDMSKIAYFPMDISLYDSTGTTKITDTTGLAVNITLPIPDSLITYAGNNKVAGVVNGQLDKLAPKFTTISGVPCISFTATHFSPYVIYVDTSNLSEASIRDNTPKTGDGIHPKWFLAMGLACISFVLFIKKDKRAVPVKVAAR